MLARFELGITAVLEKTFVPKGVSIKIGLLLVLLSLMNYCDPSLVYGYFYGLLKSLGLLLFPLLFGCLIGEFAGDGDDFVCIFSNILFFNVLLLLCSRLLWSSSVSLWLANAASDTFSKYFWCAFFSRNCMYSAGRMNTAIINKIRIPMSIHAALVD